MPLYDYQCIECGRELEVHFSLREHSDPKDLKCSGCNGVRSFRQVLRPTSVQDWGNDGQGRFMRDVSHEGKTFFSKSDYKSYMRKKGLRDDIWM